MEARSTVQALRYRGRLAPSPTGRLHIGHACTFWTAYQRAIAHKGTLVFRDEDLDPQRSKAEFAQAMIEDLHWLGIRWQEGPDIWRSLCALSAEPAPPALSGNLAPAA